MLKSEDLRQFTGTTQWFAIGAPFPDVIFTEGVEYLAREGQAQWLVVAIAAHLTTKPAFRLDHMLFWKLTKGENDSAVLTAVRDTGLPPCVRQVIPWTDFPLQEVEIWSSFNGEVWTLYLPSEH